MTPQPLSLHHSTALPLQGAAVPFMHSGQPVVVSPLFVLCPAEYALKKPHVYFVTMRQLLAWMENPIPADQLTAENLGCGNPGGAGAGQVRGGAGPLSCAAALVCKQSACCCFVAQASRAKSPNSMHFCGTRLWLS